MRSFRQLSIPALAIVAAGCQQSGVTTDEMQQLAIERTREVLSLPAGTPLEARVWTGREYEGEGVLCGTVSGTQAAQVRPQRFAATATPVRWLVFEDAHAATPQSQPDKFQEWTDLCAGTQAA